MPKKIFLILIIGVFLFSACSATPSEPTPLPDVDVSEGDDMTLDGDRMPCSTVYDYEITPETAQYQTIIDQQPPVTEEDWIYGDFNAPVTIVEYADFQCPACVGFSLGIKQMIEEYPSTIRVVLRHLPLPSIHDKAYISAMAAEAAGAQGNFWEMHDLLYLNQREWSSLSVDDFIEWAIFQAEVLELDVDQFVADLNDENLRSELEEVTNERLALGMNYTPFVDLNGRIWRDNKPDLYGLIGIHEYGGYEVCPPWVIDAEDSYTARLDTSAGEIVIDLFADVAPIAVNSFVFLAQNGWYDGIYFHRVVEGFVAQAGDPSGLGVLGPGYTFINETDNNFSFDRAGVLGMANAGVDTNGSQFFITLANTENLDGGYTIFGQVTEDSLSILDDIALRDPQTAIDFDNATIINRIELIRE